MRNKYLELVVGTLFNYYKTRNSIPLFHSQSIVSVALYGIMFNIYMITNDFMRMHFFALEDGNGYILVAIILLIFVYVFFSTKQAPYVARMLSDGKVRSKALFCTWALFVLSFPLFIFLAANRHRFW